jgi:hypothetical protein
MKDQILAIQEMDSIEEIKTATVEVLLNLATKIEALEDKVEATRETIGVIASGNTSHATNNIIG